MNNDALEPRRGGPTEDVARGSPSKRRRWIVTFCLAAFAGVALYVCRAPLLTCYARVLTADQPPRRGDAIALFLSELESAAALDEAARLYHAGQTQQLLLIPTEPGRIVQLGILPPDEEVARSRLAALGVPHAAIAVLGHTERLVSPDLRPLRDWLLQQHQERTVTCFVSPFASRRHAVVTRSRLYGERKRIHWLSMPDERFDAANWWHSRPGVLKIFRETLTLAHAFLFGPGDTADRQPSPFVTWGAVAAAIGLAVVAVRRTRWRRYVAGLASTIFLFVAFHPVVLPYAADFLDISSVPHESDDVLVLNGRPETRPFVAAELVRNGFASEVLITTASPTPATDDNLLPPEHEIVSRVLQVEGVAGQGIRLLPGAITSTYDEAQSLARFLEQNPDRSVTIVSDAFHLRRARWVFRRVLGNDAAKRLSFAGAKIEGVDRGNWWKTQNGVSTYLCEYLKFVYYWLAFG